MGRKQKKRKFRQLWITRINSAARINETKYSSLINNLKQSKIVLNRKMLAQLSILDPKAFTQLVVTTNK